MIETKFPKIEKDFPIPALGIRKNSLAELLRQMSPGDSVFFKNRSGPNPVKEDSLRAIAGRLDIKIIIRKQVGGFRLWRLE